jgi:ectoine hydroxylase-related dioxygenase (phytanoyl-CoA dioxygenase family)
VTSTSVDTSDWTLSRDGFSLVSRVVSAESVERLVAALDSYEPRGESTREKSGRVYALRNLMRDVPAVVELAVGDEIRAVVEPVLGPGAFPVRALLFDKHPEANWKVAWHQDLSIAVAARVDDAPGFGPWSVKAGVQHVQPPVAVLERMLTVRVHHDDCGADNGPLLVLPGSHAAGVLSPEALGDRRRDVALVACHVPAGGAVVMRPLLLRASSAARAPAHRRVIHIEYAAEELPYGLEWAERAGSTD